VYTPGEIDIKEMQLPASISMAHQIRFTSNAIYMVDGTGISQYEWNK
jgi:deoxyinosine 3'endonuclease (endonuclease V)